ncbi:FkbM family methyltransferase [Agrobacterium sp. NPDC089420]|uniref:FkbM family methyltransferase n=1 Tax=Agrobacterium sp. NPDC089420 TaxID=3363918 RepID=UPI00384EC5CA
MDLSSYVTALYHGLLGRAPDAAGLEHFTAVAQQEGLSEVVTALVGSAEYQHRQAQQMRPSPIEMPIVDRELVIVDVGAQKLVSEDHIYTPLRKSGVSHRCIGFEPLEHRRAEMMADDPDLQLFPDFIGDGSLQTFYVNNDDATSSLLPLNRNLNAHLEHLETLETVDTQPVSTSTLDNVLSDVPVVDFLKLDIQGMELKALKGGVDVLKRTNVIHCEVEFAPIYDGQPLFSDVELFLREHGFIFVDFTAECRYAYVGHGFKERLGWGDAVFFRSNANGSDKIAQAVIATYVYGKNGLAERLLANQFL